MAGETQAITGFGSEFWLAATAGGEPTEMGEVIALDPGAEEWGTADATHFKSPGRRIERIKTLIDSGQGSFQVNWLPGNTTDVVITEAWTSAAAVPFKMIVPTIAAGRWQVSGTANVLSRTPTIEKDGVLTCTINLDFTGARTEGAAT